MRCKKNYKVFYLTLALYLLLAVLSLSSSQAAPVTKIKKPEQQKTTRSKVVKRDPLTLHDYITTVCSRNCVEQEQLLSSVSTAAIETGADVKTLLTIISIESRFDTRAKNGKSVGLHQVHLRWHAKKFPNKNYYDVDENVSVGASIYGECLKKHKGVRDQALRCYNGYHHGDPNYLKKFNRVYAVVNRLVDLQRDPQGETRTTSSRSPALTVEL